jgi:lipoate-protein ligase A
LAGTRSRLGGAPAPAFPSGLCEPIEAAVRVEAKEKRATMQDEAGRGEAGEPGVPLHLPYEEALARERAMLAAADGGPGLTWMLWQTGPCIVVPRSHVSRPAFEAAAASSAARGWPVHIRDTGGGAVVQGHGVVNLSMAFCIGAALRDRIGTSYRILCEPVMVMLRGRGLHGAWRAIPGTMCDGAYNIVVGDRKLAGTAQRWRSLGRARPGEHAVLAHLAMFANLDHAEAAEGINALYADMGTEAGIEASSHINWAEIDTSSDGPAGAGRVAALARELDEACRALRLEELLEQGLRSRTA